MSLSSALIADLDRCLSCEKSAPLSEDELCSPCAVAWRSCIPTEEVGKCPCCRLDRSSMHNISDLYTSDLFPREEAPLCLTHIMNKVKRVLEMRTPDTSHYGDVRNTGTL